MFDSEAHAEDLEKEASSRVSTMGLQANKALQRVRIETEHTKGLHPPAPGILRKRKPLKNRSTGLALPANKALKYSKIVPPTSARCLSDAVPGKSAKRSKDSEGFGH